MSEFDEPLPDTLLYRNDSLSVAQRDASRRSLADLMNPTAEVEAVEALTSPTAEPSAAGRGERRISADVLRISSKGFF